MLQLEKSNNHFQWHIQRKRVYQVLNTCIIRIFELPVKSLGGTLISSSSDKSLKLSFLFSPSSPSS